MKPITYILEVYKPGTTNVLASFQAIAPFQSVQMGDFINPRQWEDSEVSTKTLVVVAIQHTIWEEDDYIKHKISLTTAISVSYELVEVDRVKIGDDD